MPQRRSFGGEVGEILWGALHPSGFFTGATVGAVVLAVGWFLLQGGAARAMPLVMQGLLSLFLARIALNTAFSGGDGGVFTSQGATWADSGAAAVRLFLLNLLWSVPVVVLLKGPQLIGLAGPQMGAPQAAIMLVLAALPPLFLIAAVAARGAGELLEPGFWRTLFGGRSADVATVYGVFFGGLALAAMGSMLAATAVGSGRPRFTFFLMLVAGSYSAGVFLLLLGRLVGGFVRSAGDEAEVWNEDGPKASPLADHPLGDPFEDDDEDFDVSEPEDDRSATGEPTQAWNAILHQDIEDELLPRARPERERAAPPAAEGESSVPSRTERLRANARRAEEDPEAALEEVERWIESEGPHPLVLIRRSELKMARGDGEDTGLAEAIEAARRTGAIGALADLYLAAPEHFEREGYQAGDALKMAESLLTHRRPADAATLYLRELKDDASSLVAIKGIIGIADRALAREGEAESTLELLDALDEAAPDHSFGDFVAGLREDAERRLARSH